MMNNPQTLAEQHESAAEQPIKIPFNLRVIRTRLTARKALLLAIVAASLILGLIAGTLFGHKTFEASTVLLYTPPAGAGPETDGNEAPSLLTQLDMLKIPANLEETRKRLKLNTSIEKLGAAVSAEVPINSSLMVTQVQWNSAEKAAAIANTLRDVFLERQLAIQHQQAASKVRDLETRLEKVQTDLRTAESNLKDFTIKNHVVDIDKETGWYLQQLINVELVYEQAVGDKHADQLQESKINNIMDELKTKARDEEDLVLADPGKASLDPATRAEGDAIRGRMANLKMKEAELQRDKTLYEDGILSKADLEKAKAGYESEKFALYNNSPSAGLLKEMTLKEFTVRLNGISDQQKVAQLKTAVDRVRAKLDALPLVEREYLSLQREVAIRAAERERIDQFIGLARRQNESEAFGFSLVSPARPPIMPTSSNRRPLFIAITLASILLGSVGVLALEIMDRRIFSTADASTKLTEPILAGFMLGEEITATRSDNFLTLASKLRQRGLEPGSRLLLLSSRPSEGAPQIALSLANTLSATGDSCLLLDSDFRDEPDVLQFHEEKPSGSALQRCKRRVTTLLQPGINHAAGSIDGSSLTRLTGTVGSKGFSDILSGNSPEEMSVELQKGLRFLSSGTQKRPELLVSAQLGNSLRSICRQDEITIVCTAPALTYPDATFVARSMTFAVIVIAAEQCTAAEIERTSTYLKQSGVTLLGGVVTGIAEAYAERDVR